MTQPETRVVRLGVTFRARGKSYPPGTPLRLRRRAADRLAAAHPYDELTEAAKAEARRPGAVATVIHNVPRRRKLTDLNEMAERWGDHDRGSFQEAAPSG